MPTSQVFFWAADKHGCAYYRCELPARVLSDAGTKTAVVRTLLMTHVDQDTTVVGQRVMAPGPSEYWRTTVRRGAGRLVYEMDDDIWAIPPDNPGSRVWAQREVQTDVEKNLTVADAVTVTTEALADRVSQFNQNVHIIPNAVPEWLLSWERPQRDRFTIGWGGSATHKGDWVGWDRYLLRWLQRHPDIDLHLMGDTTVADAPNTVTTGWTTGVETYLKKIDFDVLFVPLAHNTFNQSKSPIKALEAMALGIPVAAADRGPYRHLIEHQKTGLLVDEPHQLGKALDTMLDPTERDRYARNARTVVWPFHTITARLNDWRTALLGGS